MARAWVNGQYKEVSEEELANLSRAQGLPQAPSSPIGAASIGASPDAAKMTGVPAQRIASRSQDTLQTNDRQAQAQKAPTADQAQKTQKGQQLQQQYGDLQTRAQAMVQSKLAAQPQAAPGAAQQSVADAATVSQTAIKELGITDPAQQQLVTGLLQNALRSGYMPPEDKQKLNAAGIDWTHLQKYVGDANTAIGKSISQTTPDKILASDVQVSSQELTDLGLPPTATLQDVQNSLQQKIQDEFAQTDSLKQQALNPNLGPQERQAALSELKNMGATGIFASEQDMKGLSDAVDQADVVMFNGKPSNVADLLKDENISDVISTALTDPAAMASLEKNNPEFANLIKKHENAFRDLSAGLDKIGHQVADVQTFNSSIGKTSGGDLSPDVMKTLFPNSSDFNVQKIDPNKIALYKNFLGKDDIDPQAKKQVVDFLNANPDMAKEFSNLNPAAIQKLGLDKPNSKTFQDFQTFQQAGKALLTDKDNDGKPDKDSPLYSANQNDILNTLFGTSDLKISDLITTISRNPGMKKEFDVDKSGTVTAADITKMAEQQYGKQSLSGYLNKPNLPYSGESLKSIIQGEMGKVGKEQEVKTAEKTAIKQSEEALSHATQDAFGSPNFKTTMSGFYKGADEYIKSHSMDTTTKMPKNINQGNLDKLKDILKTSETTGNMSTAAKKTLKDTIGAFESAIEENKRQPGIGKAGTIATDLTQPPKGTKTIKAKAPAPSSKKLGSTVGTGAISLGK